MKKVFYYLKGYAVQSILGPLFKLGEATLELFVPLVVAKIIDVGIPNSDKNYIIKMGLILLGLAFAGLLMSVTAQYFAARASVGCVTKMRSALFAHIQTLSYSDLDSLGTSTVITRMTGDMNQIQTGLNIGLRLLLRSPFVVLGAMVMAFTIDTREALIFAGAIPILATVIFGIMLAGIPLYKKTQGKLDSVLRLTRENLTGVRVIRAFGREKEETARFVGSNNALVAIQEFAGKIAAVLNPATYVIINAAVIILIYSGAVKVNAGTLTQGETVALYNYMSQILIELIKFASLIISITKAAACANRVSDILDMSPSFEGGDVIGGSDTDEAVRFENVYLKYNETGGDALEDISFTLKKGQTLGIIGGTGAGKTSVVNLIPGFYHAAKGNVYVDGVNVNDWNQNSLKDRIGVVEQKATLFSGTIRDNLKWGDENATDEEIMSAARTAQAEDVINSKESGLDSVIEQGGKNLSGGQRQRLTIARALVKKPEILILDDSSSALDFATDAKLRKAIASIKDTSVIIVSQRTSSIKHADVIAVLDDGRLAGLGTHSELLENCPVYKEIYDSQYKKAGEEK
ncbi:MAG: ABC transporter ATP-binding protein [Oscillospiraceae bacterium]|nr:ABC transporter ATP-binding protein [Oscillospiraceae bacterium]MDY3937447.1 ABC transporter ATP-binding protein [Oscillospiraceae bacterium]